MSSGHIPSRARAASQLTSSPSPSPTHAGVLILYLGISRSRRSLNRSMVDECERACVRELRARVIKEHPVRDCWSSCISETGATRVWQLTILDLLPLFVSSSLRLDHSARSGWDPRRPHHLQRCCPRAGYASGRPPRRSYSWPSCSLGHGRRRRIRGFRDRRASRVQEQGLHSRRARASRLSWRGGTRWKM
jgi:hypothetical protein